MELTKTHYTYDGPVLLFGRCIMDNWKAETYATTEARAKSNFAYQFKNFYGRVANSAIELPGKIEVGS